MKSSLGIFVVLLALGAITAELPAQSPAATLEIELASVSPTVGLDVLVSFRKFGPVANHQVFVFVGAPVSSSAPPAVYTHNRQTFTLPLSGNVIPLVAGVTAGTMWSASNVAIPVGLTYSPNLEAVALIVHPSGQFRYSALVPFGPIIEDAIN